MLEQIIKQNKMMKCYRSFKSLANLSFEGNTYENLSSRLTCVYKNIFKCIDFGHYPRFHDSSKAKP
jgi:hypothetical protein